MQVDSVRVEVVGGLDDVVPGEHPGGGKVDVVLLLLGRAVLRLVVKFRKALQRGGGRERARNVLPHDSFEE